MKKKVIAFLLSVVLASGSIVPALAVETASETTAEEAVVVGEETAEETTEESEGLTEETEDAETGEVTEEASEGESAEEIEEELVQELTEEAENGETETTEETEMTEYSEEADTADTSAEMAEVEEPETVTEEAVAEAEGKEAKLAGTEDVVDSGTCGDSLTWVLTGTEPDLTLTIRGSGKMSDWSHNSSYKYSPWYSRRLSIKTVIVENGVTSIGSYVFCGCSSLTSITIPDSVTSIGEYAFYGCLSLTSITIPDSVTSIGECAFYKCSSLTSITIPDSVTSIGVSAFYDCSSLASVTIPDSVTSIGSYVFCGCSSLTSITIPNSVTSIGDYAFEYCNNLTSITIPDSVTSIGVSAFYKCSSLTSITIPDSVTSIGDYAFSYCYKLNSAMIPDSVTSIGYSAFHGCNLLTVLTSNNYVIGYCRSHSIKCLPYIKDVYPEIGAENVDHNSSKLFFIDFCYNVTPNDGYAYLYESGKDDPIERIHISDSETTGYSFVNNGLELMFPIDSLQRGKTYSIAIDKNALRFVDDNWDEVNVDFPGLDKDIWEFTTVDLDYFAFDNPKVTVPLKLYSRLFGVWSPFIKGCEENGSNGLCFGLNYLIGLNELHDGPIGEYLNTAGTTLSGLQKEELKDIKPDGFNESLLEYLQMAFIYQYTSEMQKQAEVNLDKYDKLYEATNSLKTDPITVGFRTKDGSYHAIYPIKRLVDNDAYCEVLVYDSGQHEFSEGSHSGLKTHLEKLRINKDGGECEGATYKGKGCMNITFRVISQSFNGVASPSYQMCSLITSINNLKASINDLEAKITLIESTIGEDTGIDSDLYLYWLEGKALDVNLSENNTLSIIGEHDEIKVTANTGASVSLDIENNTARVDNTNASESDYTITHSYTEDDNKQSVVIKGETSSTVNTEKTEDGIIVKNEDDTPVLAEISIVENDEEVQTVEVNATTDSININYDDSNTLTVTEDTDSDGTYETVIIAEGDAKKITDAEVTGISNKQYTGSPITQSLSVRLDGIELIEGSDYTVEYSDNTKVGTATITITGVGKYTGSVTKTFTIKKAPNTITAKSIVKSYSAKVQTFDLGVKAKNGTPTYKSDNKSVTVSKTGKVTVKAKFIGNANITIKSPASTNYTSATKTIVIKVMPTKTKFTSATNVATRKMALKWVKRTNATGYVIQYSTSSTFAGAKTVRIGKYTTVATTISNLVKGKKYYVRIKTYRTVSGTKYYSGWSTVMSVKITK